MKILIPFALFFWNLASGAEIDLLDRLSAPQIAEAVSRIRASSLPGPAIDANEIERSTLQGLLARRGQGARLVALDAPVGARSPQIFRAELLPRSINYCRLGDLTPENLASLAAELKKQPSAAAVVFDLRATQEGSSYELAAQVVNLFAPPADAYFRLQKSSATEQQTFGSGQQPAFSGLVAILINSDCSGPAETIAASLRQQARALLVGVGTTGKALEYQRFPLDEKTAIEVAEGRILLPDGTVDLSRGVQPDLVVKASLENERKILAASVAEGLGRYLFEVERPHLNEASLVANRNPEIDLYRERQAKGDAPEVEPLLDRSLQRALDALTTVLVSRAPSGQ